MKSLRNLISAICWVWGLATLVVFIVLMILTKSFAIIGFLVGAILSLITWWVYVGLNDDL